MSEDDRDRLHAAKISVRMALVGHVVGASDRAEALSSMIAFLRDEADLFSTTEEVRLFLVGEPGRQFYPPFPPGFHILPPR